MDRTSASAAVGPGVERLPRTGQVGFAELVYADTSWLRTEFDAIIAANFGTAALRPGTPWRRPPLPPRERHGRPGGADRPVLPPAPAVTGDLARSARGAGARQRSPPPHTWLRRDRELTPER